MNKPALAAASALAVVAGLSPAPADACSPIPTELRAVRPVDGASDVPLNARLVLAFDGFGAVRYQVSLQVAGSSVAQDLGEIAPDAQAVLPTSMALPEGTPGTQVTLTLTPNEAEALAQTETITFTYGSASDTTPPSAPVSPDISLQAHTSDGNTCEPFESGDYLRVTPPQAFDPEVLAYAVYVRHPDRIGEAAEPRLATWLLATDDLTARRIGFYEASETVCVASRTIDRAGNASDLSDEACLTANTGCESAQGSLPTFAALGLILGALALGRRRRA